jgi:HAE1 family hydrophobic/amphiphilic exporter-1
MSLPNINSYILFIIIFLVLSCEKEQIQVRMYRDRLEGKQLTVQNVADSIFSANFEYPAGTIREGEKDLQVKTSGLFTRMDDIAETPIMYNNGSLLRIGDIAEVVRTIQRQEAFFLYNDLECVRVGIKKKNEASPLTVSSAVKNELDQLNDMYGNWYHFEIIEDMSIEIQKSLLFLLLSALAGIVITAVTVRLFLKQWKISLVVTGIIPVSIAVSVTALLAAGKTLNTLSLSGIALGIGMVVDAGLVVVENVQKKLRLQVNKYNQAIPTRFSSP